MSLQVPWLGLVGVDRQVVRLAVALRDEGPLHPGREPGSAAAAQHGVLHGRDHVVRRHRQRLRQRLVTAGPAVTGHGEGVGLVPVRRQHRGKGRGHSRTSVMCWLRRRPAVRLGELEADQAGGTGRRPVRGLPVAEAGEDAGRFLPGAQPARSPGRRDRVTRPQVVDQPPGRIRRHVVEELPVDHDHRGVVAGRVALDALEADLAVRGDDGVVPVVAFGAVAEMPCEFGVDLVAAHDGAQRVRADAHLVLACQAVLVHRVEGHHARDLGLGTPEDLGAELDAVVGDVSLLGLHQVQQRQQRRPRPRVPADDVGGIRAQPGQCFVTERHYLSTPPITGSMDAIAGITSARFPPSHSVATACIWWNEGSRRWAR